VHGDDDCMKLQFRESSNEVFIKSANNSIENGGSYHVGFSWDVTMQKLALTLNGFWSNCVESSKNLGDGFTNQKVIIGNYWDSFLTSQVKVTRISLSQGYKDSWAWHMQHHLAHLHNYYLSTTRSINDYTMAVMRPIA